MYQCNIIHKHCYIRVNLEHIKLPEYGYIQVNYHTWEKFGGVKQ